MRWCTLGFTFPTLLSGRKANLLGSKNVGGVNPNVHHLILVSTLHTLNFFVTTCIAIIPWCNLNLSLLVQSSDCDSVTALSRTPHAASTQEDGKCGKIRRLEETEGVGCWSCAEWLGRAWCSNSWHSAAKHYGRRDSRPDGGSERTVWFAPDLPSYY